MITIQHRRPRPGVPADRGAQPVLRQRVEPRRPHRRRATSARSASCRHHRASTQRADRGRTTTTSDQRRTSLSTWLPTQSQSRRSTPPGDWRYDSLDDGLHVLRRGPDAPPGMTYYMTAVEPELRPRDDGHRAPGHRLTGTQLTELPPGLPPSSARSRPRETADLHRPASRRPWPSRTTSARTAPTSSTVRRTATAATRWRPSSTRAPRSALTGYCEQFAAAMAVMARTINIPAGWPSGSSSPTSRGRRHLRLQRARPARLARAVLPGRRLGAVRAHARRSAPRPCRAYTKFEFPAAPETDLPSSAGSEDAENRPTLGADPKEQNPQDQAGDARWRRPVAADRDRRAGRGAAGRRWRCCRGSSGVGVASAG